MHFAKLGLLPITKGFENTIEKLEFSPVFAFCGFSIFSSLPCGIIQPVIKTLGLQSLKNKLVKFCLEKYCLAS